MANPITLEGLAVAVLVGSSPDSFVTTRLAEAQVDFGGFVGDLHAGVTMLSGGRTPHFPRRTEIRNTRQVSIVSVEELERIAAQIGVPQLLPEWFGANLLVEGIPNLTFLPPSTRLFFPQETTLVVEGENRPCSNLAAVIQAQYPELEKLGPRLIEAALGRRGIVAWVERPGLIRQGDRLRVEAPRQVLYRTDQVLRQ
jgi:hypothetical protein